MNALRNVINKKLVASLLLALITVIGTPTAARAITVANGDFEAETVTSGLNKQVLIKSDSAASGGKNVTMLINGTISKTVTTPNVTAVKVTAKGNQCSGAPLMTVKIDGTAVMSNIAVSATSYAGYNSPSLTSVKSGTHTVAISFTNDYYNSSTNCDRNLIVDKVEFTPGTTGDTSPPVAAIVNPVNGATVSGSIPAQATANDNVAVARVEFYIDADPRLNSSATPYRTETNAPYCLAGDNGTCYGWNTASVADGAHTIVVKAVDTSGNAGFASSSFTVSNSSSTQPPTTNGVITDSTASGGSAVEFHTNGQGVKTTSTPDITGITITAKGDQCSGAPQMTVLIDGNTVLNASVSSTSYTAYKATYNKIAAGSHTVTVQYTNDYYTSTTCDRNLIVDKVEFTPASSTPITDTTPPTVSIATPSSGGTTVSGSLAIKANASDDVGVTKVDFYLVSGSSPADPTKQQPIATSNAAPYCLAGTASSTTCNGWDSTKVANGTYTVTAIAYDAAGHSTPASRTFNVSNSTSTTPGTLVFFSDFANKGVSNYYEAVHGASFYKIVNDPAGLPRKVVQMTVTAADTGPTSNPRAQLGTSKFWAPEQEYYDGFSMYFNDDWSWSTGSNTSYWMTVHQIYGPPYAGTGPANLNVKSNKSTNHTPYLTWERPDYNYDQAFQYPIVTKHWYDLVWHEHLSADPTKGFVELWINGGNGYQQIMLDGKPRLYGYTINSANNGGNNSSNIQLYMDSRIFSSGLIKQGGAATLFFGDQKIGTTFDIVAPHTYN